MPLALPIMLAVSVFIKLDISLSAIQPIIQVNMYEAYITLRPPRPLPDPSGPPRLPGSPPNGP